MTLQNILTAVLFFALPPLLFSQKILTQAEVVKTTLENNYGIRVAKNEVEVARNNTDRGLNGYNPSVNATAGPSASLGSGLQKFNGPLGEAKINNALAWSANASVSANYTLFNKARDYSLAQLKEVLNLSDLQLRQTMETNLIQVLNSYYEVARLTENLSVLEQTFEVSRRRLERAQYRFEYGQGIRLDVLNAEVDIQRDSINLLNVRQQLANAKRNLNFVMGTPVDNTFLVDTTVTYATNFSQQQLVSEAKSNNVAILAADQNLTIREMDLQIIDAGRKPTIGAQAAYTYNYQDNAAGSFIATSRTNGLNAGLTLNWDIYDGGRRKVQEQNTRLAIMNQLVGKEQIEQELERNVRNAWESHQNALFVLDVEKRALETNRLNLERTEELFNAGQVTSVEFRQAQLNLLNSTVSYSTAKYNAKVVELTLLQLTGKLLDEIR